VGVEPFDRQSSHRIECTRFLEQVTGAIHDRNTVRAAELVGGVAVELEHIGITTPDDQERRGLDRCEVFGREIRSASPRDDRAHRRADLGCGLERRRRPG